MLGPSVIGFFLFLCLRWNDATRAGVFSGGSVLHPNTGWSHDLLSPNGKPSPDIEDYEQTDDYEETGEDGGPSDGRTETEEAQSPNESKGFLRIEKPLTNITKDSGLDVRLRCEFSGDPKPGNIKWFKNEAPVMVEKGRLFWRHTSPKEGFARSTLKINDVDTHDTGYYKCEACNAVRCLDTTGIVIVKMKPWEKVHIQSAPAIPDYNSNLNIPNLSPSFTGRFAGIVDFPETIDTSDLGGPLSGAGFCQAYRGVTCSKFIGNRTIFVRSTLSQGQTEERLARAFSIIAESKELTKECAEYAIPLLCFNSFPLCEEPTAARVAPPIQANGYPFSFGLSDVNVPPYPAPGVSVRPIQLQRMSQPSPRSICRDECEILENDICRSEYNLVKRQPELGHLITLPECKRLPSVESPEARNCVRLEIPHVTPVHLGDTCYNGNGEEYRGTESSSESGGQCLHWNQYHATLHHITSYPTLIGHNYCRNPGGLQPQPWCFVAADKTELCRVPKCGSLLWLYILIPTIGVALLVGLLVAIWCMRYRLRTAKSAIGSRPPGSTASDYSRHQAGNSVELNALIAGKSISSKPKGYASAGTPREIPRSTFRIIHELGEGHFGVVYKAEMLHNGKENGSTAGSHASTDSKTVIAIKTLKESSSVQTEQEFRKEIGVLNELQHVNVACLVGVCSKDGPLTMVFEYLCFGDLHELLVRHSPRSDYSMNSEDERLFGFVGRSGSGGLALRSSDFLSVAKQIAAGMEYLSSRQYVHRDLATRNCLVGEQLSIKIANFGIARDSYSADYYCLPTATAGALLLPIRWMPPEAVLYGRLSTESDVWAFGVTLWEIYSYGSQPYCGYTNTEVVDLLRHHQILSCPEDCPSHVYTLMIECWNENGSRRPTFKAIHTRLKTWEGLHHPAPYPHLIHHHLQHQNSYSPTHQLHHHSSNASSHSAGNLNPKPEQQQLTVFRDGATTNTTNSTNNTGTSHLSSSTASYHRPAPTTDGFLLNNLHRPLPNPPGRGYTTPSSHNYETISSHSTCSTHSALTTFFPPSTTVSTLIPSVPYLGKPVPLPQAPAPKDLTLLNV